MAALESESDHYLICVQGVSNEALAAIEHGIHTGAYAYWSYLNGIWIVCAGRGTIGTWASWLTGIVQKDEGRCLLLDLKRGTFATGLLPAPAWDWLQRHLQKS